MKRILVLWLFLGFISCKNDDEDCSTRLSCVGPEINFQFEFIETGEDPFSDGTYLPGDLTIIDTATGEEFPISFGVSTQGGTVFVIYDGIGNFDRSLRVALSNEIDFTIDYTLIDEGRSGCCPDFRYENIEFNHVDVQAGDDSNAFLLFI